MLAENLTLALSMGLLWRAERLADTKHSTTRFSFFLQFGHLQSQGFLVVKQEIYKATKLLIMIPKHIIPTGLVHLTLAPILHVLGREVEEVRSSCTLLHSSQMPIFLNRTKAEEADTSHRETLPTRRPIVGGGVAVAGPHSIGHPARKDQAVLLVVCAAACP
jgi:hypothetical protein